jgi:hypothetical protein
MSGWSQSLTLVGLVLPRLVAYPSFRGGIGSQRKTSGERFVSLLFSSHAMLSNREFFTRFKADEKGGLVDISSLDRQRLDTLVEFYRLKSRRAHTASMKELYAGIAEDIRVFRNSGKLPERIDALTFSKFMRIQDVGDFARRYWNGEVFSDEDETIGFYREWRTRHVPYRRPSIPPDKMITELLRQSRHREFSDILNKLAQYYRVTKPSLAVRTDPEMDYYLEYHSTPALLFVNDAKLPKSENMFVAVLQGFFRHLARKRAWQFSANMVRSYTIEKREAELFAKRICERLVALGLMKTRR